MSAFIIRRLLQMIPLLFGITLLTFAIISAGGSPINQVDLGPRAKPADIQRIRQQLGLDQPWYERYFTWLSHVVRGDLGLSLETFTPVPTRILNVLPNTLLLACLAVVVALTIAIPLGIYAAVHRNSLFDRFATVGGVVGYAVPTVWLGLLLIILFSVKFHEWGLPYLPVGGVRDLRSESGLTDRIRHLILPVTALALPQIAGWSIFIRSSMLEVIRQDFVRTADAKGMRRRTVLYAHAFRNALLPLVTLVGLSLPDLFGGSIVVENVFGYPGMGQLTVRAVFKQDYTLIMGTTLFFAVLVILGNLLADVLYVVFDPRIRYN
jgi:peptide/nickel transport system permease protein